MKDHDVANMQRLVEGWRRQGKRFREIAKRENTRGDYEIEHRFLAMAVVVESCADELERELTGETQP